MLLEATVDGSGEDDLVGRAEDQSFGQLFETDVRELMQQYIAVRNRRMRGNGNGTQAPNGYPSR